MLDSHQRLSDVADNAVCNRYVVQSYTNQVDNCGGISRTNGAGNGTISSGSSVGATSYSAFDYQLNAILTLNQEELSNVVVTSRQNAIVEGQAAVQNDRVACTKSLACERIVVSTSYFMVEVVGVFDGIHCSSSDFALVQNCGLTSVCGVEVVDCFLSSKHFVFLSFLAGSNSVSSSLVRISSLSSNQSFFSVVQIANSSAVVSASKTIVYFSFSCFFFRDSGEFSNVSSSCFESCGASVCVTLQSSIQQSTVSICSSCFYVQVINFFRETPNKSPNVLKCA